MLPHLTMILQAKGRYFWCVSTCHGSEMLFTFVEVSRTEKEKNEFVRGKQVLKKIVDYSILSYSNGILVVTYSRSEIVAKIKQKDIKITDQYLSEDGIKRIISYEQKIMIEKSEVNYGR